MKPIILGILSAFFFSFTFVLNRAMELSGGSWIWSASLRYIVMVPLLLVVVAYRRNLGSLIQEMRKEPIPWLLWSFIGFGLFYAPLCYASAYGPGWLIAATWQITIISGSLLAPLFYERIHSSNGPIKVRGQIPYKGLAMSLIILVGVAFMQVEHATQISVKETLLCVIPIIIASFAYPLGNRKMMSIVGERLDAYQRVLGMTIASLPFWLILSLYGLLTVGPPSQGQVIQSSLVGILSGVCATVLFFAATNMVKNNMQKLGAVEATQSLEVLFAVAGEILILASPLPSVISWIGMTLIILGMVLHSRETTKRNNVKQTTIST